MALRRSVMAATTASRMTAGSSAGRGGGPSGGTGAVADLLDAIVKKKGFKQLAGYSIKCLQGLLHPSRIGWDIMARTAFELDGASAVLDVCARYHTDAELLRVGLSALRSIAMAPGTGALPADTITSSVGLLNSVWSASLTDAEKAAAVADVLEYLLVVARRSASVLPDAGLLTHVNAISSALAKGWGGDAGCNLAVAVFRLLYTVATSRDGLTAIVATDGLLPNILAAAYAVYMRADAVLTASAATQGRKSLGGKSVSGAESSLEAGVAFALLRGMLEPLFRLLERVSRVDEGSSALARCDALSPLIPFTDWWLHGADSAPAASPTLRKAMSFRGARQAAAAPASSSAAVAGSTTTLPSAVVLELFDRILGQHAARLVGIAGGADPARCASSAVTVDDSIARRQQAARLLARVAELAERVAGIAADAELLGSIVHRLAGAAAEVEGACASGQEASAALVIATGMLAALARVVERGPGGTSVPGVTSVLQRGALPAILRAAAAALCSASSVASDACAAAALRVLSVLVTVAADWGLVDDGGSVPASPAVANDCTGPTVLEFAVGYVSPVLREDKHALRQRFGTAPEFTKEIPHLLQLLAAAAANIADGSPRPALPSSAAVVPMFAASAATAWYAFAVLRVLASMAVEEGVPSPVQAVLREVIPCAALGLSTAASWYTSYADAVADGGLPAFLTPVHWLMTGTCTMAAQTLIALAVDGEDVAMMLTAGVGRSTVAILSGRDPLVQQDAAQGSSGRSYSARLTTASPNAKVRSSSRTLTRGISMNNVAVGTRGVSTGIGWMGAFSADEPSWTAAPGAGYTKAVVLAGDALYLVGTLMTYLVAHTSDTGAAALLPSSVLRAVEPLAAIADLEAGLPARDVASRGALDTVRQAVNTGLQASLVTYSTFSNDATVYANFRDVVEIANVGAEEIISAVDMLRGCAAAMLHTLQDAPTRSQTNAGNVSVHAILKSIGDALNSSEMAALDVADADAESTRAAEEQAVRARLPPYAVDYYSLLYEITGIARQKLLLLEAVSLSPFRAWAITAINGVYTLLRVLQYLATAICIHNDVDTARALKSAAPQVRLAAAGAATDKRETIAPHKLMERLDDVLTHTLLTLSHLARVGYETRQSGEYTVAHEEEDDVRIPQSLDGRIVSAALFAPETASVACSSVLHVASSGHRIAAFVPAAAHLMAWMSALTSVPPARGDTSVDSGWGLRYLTHLLSAQFTEATVGLFRIAVSALQNVSDAAGTGGAAGEMNATFDVLAILLTNLQHIAGNRAGSLAIATRGGSRQLLRAMPLLLAHTGADKSCSAYRCLVALLRVFSACMASGGTDRNLDDASGDAGASMSVGALLHKQGLVEACTSVVFSPVGIVSAASPTSTASFAVFGEACSLVIAIVSAVAVRKDVSNAVNTLYHMCDKVAAAVTEYTSASAEEAAAWGAVAAAGSAGAAAAVTQVKKASLQLGDLAGAAAAATTAMGASADAMAGGDEDDADASSSSTLLGAIQLFGLLMLTEAGRRSGVDIISHGIAACTALAQSGVAFLLAASRVIEAVTTAVTSVTASTDESKPSVPVPAAMATAASASVGAPSKQERDLVWAVAVAVQVVRITTGMLMDVCTKTASADAIALVPEASTGSDVEDALTVQGRALSLVMGSDAHLSTTLASCIDVLLAVIEMAQGQALQRMHAVSSGSLLAALLPNRSRAAATGGSSAGASASTTSGAGAGSNAPAAIVPAAHVVMCEGMSTLSLLSSAVACARSLPGAARSHGIEICLTALTTLTSHHASGSGSDSGSGHAAGAPAGGTSAGGTTTGGTAASSNPASEDGKLAASATELRAASLETTAHSLCVLAGVALAGSDMLPLLVASGATQAVMRVIGDVISAAVQTLQAASATGQLSSSSESTSSADSLQLLPVHAVSAAFRALAELASVAGTAGIAECTEMMSAGIASFMRSALALCGDESANLTVPPRPSLLRGVAMLLTRLALNGHVLARRDAGADGDDGDDDDTPAAIALRDLLLRVALCASQGRAYMDSLSPMHAVFLLILAHGDYTDGKPLSPGCADRTVEAIRQGVPKILPAVRRAMANQHATQRFLADGRAVIALLSPKDRLVVTAGETEGATHATTAEGASASSGAATVPEVDEVLEAVMAAYGKLVVLHELFKEAVARSAGTLAVAVDDTTRMAQLEEALDSLRHLSVVIMPYFPVREIDDDDGSSTTTPRATAATVWQVFCTARDYVTAVNGLLADPRGSPSSSRVTRALFETLVAALPTVARMACYAEAGRQRLIAAYWAGTSSVWELAPDQDVPLTEAVSTLGQSTDAHIACAERTLTAASASLTPSSTGAAPYVPHPPVIEALCRSLRNFVSGVGHEAVGALVNAGILPGVLRLLSALRMLVARVADASATEDEREALRSQAADADRCSSALSSFVRFMVTKGQSELQVYCVGQAGTSRDELRDVSTILPPSALAGLLRAMAQLASQTGEDDNDDDDGASAQSARSRAADAALEAQVRAIMDGKDGLRALAGVMEELGSTTLAAVTLAAPLRETASPEAARTQVKLFHAILTVLSGKLATDSSQRLAPEMGLLRGLYASMVASMHLILGDALLAASHAATVSTLYHDDAAEEHAATEEVRKDDITLHAWSVAPSAPRLASADALPVEEL